jgi:ribose-phosphate pyrophosphokinase
MLDPLSFFVKEFEEFKGDRDLIAVAPDAGATKLIMRFGKAMEIQSAVAVKYRPTQEESVINDIIGDLRAKRRAIILDDLISSAGTVSGLIRVLAEEKGIDEIYLAASHNLCLQEAYDKICDLHENGNLKKVIVTDSIPQTRAFQELDFFEVRSLSTFLARTINRIHYNHSVSELFRGERAGDEERGPADTL